jgi:hypothetical protein
MMTLYRNTRKKILLARILLAIAAGLISSTLWAENSAKPPVVHQLRIYELYKDNKDVFHERFRDDAMRIMYKYDFNIVSIWESEREDKIEFVYLLEWPNEETMKAQWEKFMADKDWSDIKRKTGKIHGRFVNGIEDRKLTLTRYSPSEILTR